MSDPFLLGDLAGFMGLGFTGASAISMVLRARLIKVMKGPEKVRKVHVLLSALAVAFIALHVSLLYLPPVTLPADLGYASAVLGVVLWGTGVGFLERNRDSFFLHGWLSIAVVALVMVHAAASGVNFPTDLALSVLAIAGGLGAVNAVYHGKKILAAKR